jgi:hypothetical protein
VSFGSSAQTSPAERRERIPGSSTLTKIVAERDVEFIGGRGCGKAKGEARKFLAEEVE